MQLGAPSSSAPIFQNVISIRIASILICFDVLKVKISQVFEVFCSYLVLPVLGTLGLEFDLFGCAHRIDGVALADLFVSSKFCKIKLDNLNVFDAIFMY